MLGQYDCLTSDQLDRLRVIQFLIVIIDVVRQNIFISYSRRHSIITVYFYPMNFVYMLWIIIYVQDIDPINFPFKNEWHLLKSTDGFYDNYKDTWVFWWDISSSRNIIFTVLLKKWEKLHLIDVPFDLLFIVRETIIRNTRLMHKKTAYIVKKYQNFSWKKLYLSLDLWYFLHDLIID